MMIRTQLYLPKQTHEQLLRVAKKRSETMATLVRRFIIKGLSTPQMNHTGKETLQALSQLHITGGPKKLSKNLDHYLYR